MVGATAFADENVKKAQNEINFIPLLKYDFLSLDSQSIHSPGGGLVVKSDDLMFVGLYLRHSVQEPLQYGYPSIYHTIDMLLDGRTGRHQYLGIFKSESDQPVYGGLKTFQTAGVYGYELVHGDSFSFVLGGGIAVGDFGIDLANGKPLPLIPVPLIRMKYCTDWIDSSFDFLTTPNLNFTIGPRSRIRLTGDLRMEQFREARDILFELTLAYRFFSHNHTMGDFAGISAGIKNDNYGAFNLHKNCGVIDLDGHDDALEVHYYAAFARIDISVLKITCGYAFGGRELYREEKTRDIGEGYFVSVEGLYQF
jgi:hypothetical protein